MRTDTAEPLRRPANQGYDWRGNDGPTTAASQVQDRPRRSHVRLRGLQGGALPVPALNANVANHLEKRVQRSTFVLTQVQVPQHPVLLPGEDASNPSS
jgi:hypothetical protein